MENLLHNVALSLGTNKGDKLAQLQVALVKLDQWAGKVKLVSSVYETEPWGYKSENIFYNMACVIETAHQPGDLLEILNQIEHAAGRYREKEKGYADRCIDIDIIFFDEIIINSEALQVPHVQMHNRKFVLMPLSEIAGNWKHPVLLLSVAQLLNECNDALRIHKVHEPISVHSH